MNNILRVIGAMSVFVAALTVSGCSSKPPADTAKGVEATDSRLKPTTTGAVPSGGGAAGGGGAQGSGVATPQ